MDKNMKQRNVIVDKKVIQFIDWTHKLGSKLEWFSKEDLISKYNNYLIRKEKSKK
jgi:hypothetical protein